SAEHITIPGGETVTVHTDLKILLPYRSWGQLASRSGMACSKIAIHGRVIDWDYRGEVQVLLHNASTAPFAVHKGACITQLIIHKSKHPQIRHNTIINYDKLYLNDTKQGERGFSHTGRVLWKETDTLLADLEEVHQSALNKYDDN
ncbi:dUTPase-like protein, partial [Wolfiporia cocos MD-104 SS10]